MGSTIYTQWVINFLKTKIKNLQGCRGALVELQCGAASGYDQNALYSCMKFSNKIKIHFKRIENELENS